MTSRLLAALLLSAAAFAQDTTMFRVDPRHSGIYQTAAVPAFHQVKWKFHTNGKIYSSPAIAGDTLYIGSHSGKLLASDLKSRSRPGSTRRTPCARSAPNSQILMARPITLPHSRTVSMTPSSSAWTACSPWAPSCPRPCPITV
ncbi:MAG: PQQ-binding-like beta-propeller repeat protein [Acidobacteriales bacterium]|nr:PQQ-binding-like beta-propeller repeat protein [Terriglobales bacterium]